MGQEDGCSLTCPDLVDLEVGNLPCSQIVAVEDTITITITVGTMDSKEGAAEEITGAGVGRNI